MPPGLACPNPACDHVFAPAAVAGAKTLVCPRCGQQFHFRTSPSTAIPAADLFTLPAPPGRPAPRRYRRSSRLLVNYSVLVVFLGILGAACFRAYRWYTIQHAAFEKSSSAAGQVMTARDYNCQFTIPPDWQEDENLRVPVGANLLALRRATPRCWFALAALDSKDHTPPVADMVPEVIGRLSGYFNPTNLEWAQAKAAGPTIAGQPTLRLTFQGEVQAVPMAGTVYILTARGLAYWLICWVPRGEADNLDAEARNLAARFSLLHERDHWKPRQPPARLFTGPDEAFTLRDTRGLWEREPQARIVHPDAQLLLRAHDPQAPKDVARMAQVLVLHLGPQPDLATAAALVRKHFEDREHRENPGIKIERVASKEGAEAEVKIGNVRGAIVRLHVAGDNRRRLIILAVVRLPQQVLAIQLDAYWDRRAWWEQEFNRLLDTFHCRAE